MKEKKQKRKGKKNNQTQCNRLRIIVDRYTQKKTKKKSISIPIKSYTTHFLKGAI